MTIEDIERRWAYKNLVTYQGMNEGTAAQLDEDIRKLVKVVEASANLAGYLYAHNMWEGSNLQKAFIELKGG